jgi:tetratricopeptide (TPR) repeat protein
MTATRQPVKIFLASSGDLKDERDFCEVLFNRIGKVHSHLHLEPIRWEIDLESGSVNAARIQDAINPLLDVSDVVFVLCYSRLGVFTLEEYHRTLDAGKKLFVYFKSGFSPTNGREEAAYSQVVALRKEMEADDKVLFKPFANNDQLENLIRHDLGLFLVKNYPNALSHSPEKPNRFLTVVPRPGFVTGRDALLADIHKTLEHDGAAALVRGIGGIGKTTAALAYLHHIEYGGRYDHIAWLEISTTLPEAFARQSKLHEKLGIRPRVEELLARNDLDEVVRATLDALDRLSGQNILVLDNANDRDEIRRWKRALTDSSCRLLLTSRAQIPNVTDVPVAELDPADGARLFYHHYRSNTPLPTEGDEAKVVMQLLSAVQHHTLLIEMLGKIGKQATLSVADLVKHVENGYVFSDKLQRTVSTGSLMERKEGGMDESTLENLVLFLFRGLALGLTDAERALLRQLAVLPPTAHDPQLLAFLFGVTDEEQSEFFNALDTIDKRGVPLKNDDAYELNDGVYQLHRLVRAVALRELKPTPENCASVLSSITKLLNFDPYNDDLISKLPFVVYGESLLETLEGNEELHIAKLQMSLSVLYCEMGNYNGAKILSEAALAFNLKNFGPDHHKVAYNQSLLAKIYDLLGDYEGSRKLLESALSSYTKNFGPDHPNVITSLSNLGTLYFNKGNYERAKKMLEVVLAFYLKNFGPNHPEVANYQSNLGIIYSNTGNYKRAEEMLNAALTSDLRNFGPEHPRIAVRQSHLGVIYMNTGNYEGARNLIEAALISDLKKLGPEHPKVALRQANLSNIYLILGNYEDARKLSEAALASDLKNFGSKHPNVAEDYYNLASIEIEERNWLAAKEHLQKALAIVLQVWGKEHPKVQAIRQTLAQVEAQLQKN